MKSSVLRNVGVVGVAGVGTALLLAGGTTAAQATTTASPPAGASLLTLGGPGDQVDPHVSGNLVTYTDFSSGDDQVIVHDLATGTDQPIIDSTFGEDYVPDVGGTTVTYTHAEASGVVRAYRYDYPNGPSAALDPGTTADDQTVSRVGGSTFVWQDDSIAGFRTPEIIGYDATTGVTTRLTDDASPDVNPAISQDGRVAVWNKCASAADTRGPTTGTDCHVWQAAHGAGGWSAPQQLTSAGNQELPDTDATYVVYGTTPAGGTQTDKTIAWQPVGGGQEHLLDVPGYADQASISNGVIAFTQHDPNATTLNWDVWLYDIPTDTLYRLTDTPEDESFPDISVTADRSVTVAWSKQTYTDRGVSDEQIQVEQFRLPAVADTVALTPAAGSGQVGTSHSVTATVSGQGSAIAGVPVRFAVTGSVSDTDSCTTDATGACSITYQGPAQPGSDTITAYADTNGNGSRDNAEPQGTAPWTWEDAASTPGDAAGTGQIAALHGKVSFLFGAHSGTRSLLGGCLVSDPQARITITCTDATRFVENGRTVRIEGHALVNGTRTAYTITAQDGGTWGHGDTFAIQTATGYSATGSLTSGDVLVH